MEADEASSMFYSECGDEAKESEGLKAYLEYLEFKPLLDKAHKWNVEIKEEWICEQGEVQVRPGLAQNKRKYMKMYKTITYEGECALQMEIDKAKEKFYIKWVQILTPLAGLIVAFLGLIVAILGLVFKCSK
jgi:hypothetical protein